jgi:hypothetical protein
MEAFAGFRDNATCDFYLLQTYGTTLEGRFRNGNGGIFTVDSLGVLTLNSWQHLALTYDGSLLAMYRNGTLVKSVAASGSITSQNGMFRIGNMPIPGSTQIFLDGQVDETTLWKRGLTAAEVLCVMNYGAAPSDADLKLYYKMDQGTAGGSNAGATTLVNAAGGNNATLVGFALSGATSNYVDGCPVAGTLVETICPGETYTFNGQAYTAAGTYTANYPVGGCDSLATLDLRATPVNINVVQSGNNLVSQALGAQYQWLDCSNGYAEVTGATAPSFQPTTIGTFAVEVTQNGCVDTSACYPSTVGLAEGGALATLQVFVDAAQEQVVVTGAAGLGSAVVRLHDVQGRVVMSAPVQQDRTRLSVEGLPSGAYLVEVSGRAGRRAFRVVVAH